MSSKIKFIVAAVATVVILSGCASYKVKTPAGWEADIKTWRKLDTATIKIKPDGSMEVELGGVDYPDYSRYIPYPVPVFPSHIGPNGPTNLRVPL